MRKDRTHNCNWITNDHKYRSINHVKTFLNKLRYKLCIHNGKIHSQSLNCCYLAKELTPLIVQFANLLLPLSLVSSPLNKEGDLDGVQSVLCTEEEPPKRAISSVVVGVISGFCLPTWLPWRWARETINRGIKHLILTGVFVLLLYLFQYLNSMILSK